MLNLVLKSFGIRTKETLKDKDFEKTYHYPLDSKPKTMQRTTIKIPQKSDNVIKKREKEAKIELDLPNLVVQITITLSGDVIK